MMRSKKKRNVVERTLYYETLSPYAGTLKIVFLSDLHYMPARRKLYETVQNTVMEEKPDLLVFGGDFIDYRKRWFALTEWLRQFPSTMRKVAVPGNWEYYDGETSGRFFERMRAAGIIPLCNSHYSFEFHDQLIHVAGVDDYQKGMPSLRRSFDGIPDDEFCIGVSHSPDVMEDMDETYGCNLMLCGHTHGGQFRIPGFGAVVTNTRLGKRYESGLYQWGNDRFTYVSRGLGEGFVKFRFNCPHEITVLSLKHRWQDNAADAS